LGKHNPFYFSRERPEEALAMTLFNVQSREGDETRLLIADSCE
jgi:hypothetical protein